MTAAPRLDVPPAPPIKPATWEWYIPIYFWTGGISAGAWLAAAAEDTAGERDRALIRAARYLSAGALGVGTALLIADLGRPERFHHMLRLVRGRSAMSLGSWGLTTFGGFVGLAALLQAAEDGLFGRRRRLARLSRGGFGRAVHLLGLPAALFVGGYTGVLLSSTSVPTWARRTGVLGPLFLASAASSGMAAVALALELTGGGRPRALRRLRRAEAAALAAELGLAVVSRGEAARLPSGRERGQGERTARALLLAGGMAAPLVLALGERSHRRRRGKRRRPRPLGAGLALAGSLVLRYLVTGEGSRSARLPEDTWRFTAVERGR
jgi:formate-dependent nitrite reductase membrane component NrfD